jgi:hypothetical protein
MCSVLLRLSFVGALAVLAGGCGKTDQPASEPSAEVAVAAENSAPVPGQPAASPPPLQPVEINTTDLTATLDALTQVLRRYCVEQKRIPKSFSEVVAAGYVRSMPAAPAGKKFEVDQKTTRVVLVNQ